MVGEAVTKLGSLIFMRIVELPCCRGQVATLNCQKPGGVAIFGTTARIEWQPRRLNLQRIAGEIVNIT